MFEEAAKPRVTRASSFTPQISCSLSFFSSSPRISNKRDTAHSLCSFLIIRDYVSFRLTSLLLRRRQCGRVVRAPDLESGGPGFKSRSDHYLELFLGSPKFNSSASLVK